MEILQVLSTILYKGLILRFLGLEKVELEKH